MSRWPWFAAGGLLGALLLRARPAAAAVVRPSTVPDQDALSQHFRLSEFMTGLTDQERAAVPDAVRASLRSLARECLEPLREALGGRPMQVVSGYRTPRLNAAVGGAPGSQHLVGRAADVRIPGVAPRDIYAAADRLQREGRIPPGGLGLYSSFVHVDTRGHLARWIDDDARA